MEEIWKQLVYYKKDGTFVSCLDRFEISNLGNLRNKFTYKLYKLTISKTGYYSICVSLGSRSNIFLIKIHRAVLCTYSNFIKNMIINHKDGNKLNNNINNLEWVTYSENSKHAYNMGLMPKFVGNKNNNQCKSVSCYIGDKLIYTYFSARNAESITGIANSHIIACCKGKRKSAGKLNRNKLLWKYASIVQLVKQKTCNL